MKSKKSEKKNKKVTGTKEKEPITLHRSLSVKVQSGNGNKPTKGVLDQLRDKMKGSKFRWINEQLYTQSGEKSLEMIKNDESLFDTYHQGFREQVTRWPLIPVDVFIKMLKTMPRQVVGDFGCGDGSIYTECTNQTVHCFDLIARKDFVISCDIAHVPLDSGCLDVAIFCLALMGTNWSEFIVEGNRCLRIGGQLWIAEVRSRFESDEIGGEEGFIHSIEKLGFKLIRKNITNTHFGLFFFKKQKESEKKKAKSIPALKACIYKKR